MRNDWRLVEAVNRRIKDGDVVKISPANIRVVRAYMGPGHIVVRDEFRRYHSEFDCFKVNGQTYTGDRE